MKILGIIGGIAPPSTIEYYRTIVATYRERAGGAYPHVIIDSIELPRLIGPIEAGDYDGVVRFLTDELHRLARAGAELALFASNTPHLLIRELRAASPLPLVSIVDATVREARRRGVRRVGLLGTAFTMKASFYREALDVAGIAVHAPPERDLRRVHELYMGELAAGIVREETRAEVLGVVARLREAHDLDGLVLGGTELPMLIAPEHVPGLALIDTMRAHAEAAVEAMLAQGAGLR